MKHRQSCHRQLDLFVAKDPTGTDSTGRADEAVTTDECAAVGSTRRTTEAGDEDHV
ncbi:hypothetical protein NKH61_34560 [Mesorhizobium sp. M1005]|uniref:hypothetical protein n=1 Tax=unclassified Mesorhizobium TaxID=325217 RepID=UPI003335F07E